MFREHNQFEMGDFMERKCFYYNPPSSGSNHEWEEANAKNQKENAALWNKSQTDDGIEELVSKHLTKCKTLNCPNFPTHLKIAKKHAQVEAKRTTNFWEWRDRIENVIQKDVKDILNAVCLQNENNL